jgi:hypothetical protein
MEVEQYQTRAIFEKVLPLLKISREDAFRSLLQGDVGWDEREKWRRKAIRMRVRHRNGTLEPFVPVLRGQIYTDEEDLDAEVKKMAIFLINLIPDTPYVLWAGPEMGYGLFAHKDMYIDMSDRSLFVTAYGGNRAAGASGDYVLSLNPGAREESFDSRVGFKFNEKGRWINSNKFQNKPEIGKQNVNAQNNRSTGEIEFFLRKRTDVKRGDQLLWFYGPFYKLS